MEDSSSLSWIDFLCDDTLLKILAYADLPSLLHFTRETSRNLRNRFTSPSQCDYTYNNIQGDEETTKNYNVSNCCQIWRDVFANHNFAPLENFKTNEGILYSKSDHDEYLSAINVRLSFFSRLCGNNRRSQLKSTRKKLTQCFSLPNKHFNFVPIVPPDMMHFSPLGSNHQDLRLEISQELNQNGDREDLGIHPDRFHQDGVNIDNQNRVNIDMEIDPPPVEFVCNSIALTSPGTGEEFVLLNPFSGSVDVYGSILDNAIRSQEFLLEEIMVDASEGILRKREREDVTDDEKSEDIAGEAIHSCIQKLQQFKTFYIPPKQVLFSVEDYFNLDLNDYFGEHTPFGLNQFRQGNVTVDWLGVESHPALSEDCKSVTCNFIGVARTLHMETDHSNELKCTEVLAWSNDHVQSDSTGSNDSITPRLYSSKYICRAAGSLYFLDLCAKTQKLFATFESGSNFFLENILRPGTRLTANRSLIGINDDTLMNDNGDPICMSREILCLPLVKCNNSQPFPERSVTYFPSPEACITAQYPVSSFSVDVIGKTLVVGTINGTIEIWDTGLNGKNNQCTPQRLQILSVRESFLRRARSLTMDSRCFSSKDGECIIEKSSSIEIRHNFEDPESRDDLALIEHNSNDELPHKHPSSQVSQIFIPKHLPVQRCGFITMQRNTQLGTTLLLWQTTKITSEEHSHSSENRFQLMAMINLPLSAQCHPEVFYDGRRLIVFGQDHIGLIFLVYHVLSTRYDQHRFQDVNVSSQSSKKSRTCIDGEESGGVMNLNYELRIKFMNRIRHAGLGGLEYYDSIMLSANERFLIVNTKTGNLIGSDGVYSASQGLLVIDLQEYISLDVHSFV